jgi:outer membrane lipoprotein LolB
VNLARRGHGLLGAALAAMLMAGCANPPPAQTLAAAGRMAVQVAAHGEHAARGFNASFELWGQAERGELQLRTALGTWLATARWTPGQAILITPQGETAYPSLAALSEQALGEALPLDALPDWLKGKPSPQWAHQPCDLPNTPCFIQTGWRVDAREQGQGMIIATRGAPPPVTVRIRLEASGG